MLIEWMSIGGLSGALCYSQFASCFTWPAVLPSWIDKVILVTLLGCLFLVYRYKNKIGKGFIVLTLLLSFVFEIILANHSAQAILSWQLPPRYQNQVVQLTGQIKGVPYYHPQTKEAKFILRANQIGEHLDLDQNIKLYGQISLENNLILQAGDRITVTAKIKKPWGTSNPGGFDAEKNAFFNQIKATGYIQSIIAHQPAIQFGLDNLRQKIAKGMVDSLDNDKLSGMLVGLTIGVTDGILPSQWELLRQTGTTHLIAISGLHISLIGGLIFWIMNKVWRGAPRLLLWLPASIAAAYLTIAFTWAYGFLAGMSIATERACLMMTAVMLAIILKLRMSAGFIFAFSLWLILVWDPFAVLSMGFWLSYLAIGMLMYATGNRLKFTREKLSWKWIRPQFAAFIGMIPLSLYFFQSTSLISPFINVMAIPWVSFVVTPVCLLSALAFMCNMTWLGKGLILAAKYLYLPLWAGMERVVECVPAMWDFALPTGSLGVGLLGLSLLGVGIILLPKGVPYKNAVGIALLVAVLLFYRPVHLKEGEVKFALLDVGQGLASVMFTKNHVLIYDTGPKWRENDSGSQIIQPYLAYHHIKQIDTIMISHADLDHRGGLDSLVNHYPVNQLLTSEVENLAAKSNLNTLQPVLCQQGQSWIWDGVLFEVLHPTSQDKSERNRNNRSCVLKISTGQSSLLLTGDIEAGAERQLVETYGDKLAAKILIAPHHGSQTSSTLAFIQQVNPTFVLFPTGKDNRFKFPREQVLTRYHQLGSRVFNTAEEGAIMFDLTPKEISQPILWRKVQTRFWTTT